MALLSINEAARQRNVSPQTIRHWLEKGLLKSYRMNCPRGEIFLNEKMLISVQEKYDSWHQGLGRRLRHKKRKTEEIISPDLFSQRRTK